MDIINEIEFSRESHIFNKMSRWNKKLEGLKLTKLFNNKINRGGLNFNRKDKDYIEACRSKHVPLIPLNKVSTDAKVKSVRKAIGNSLPLFTD